jgi:tetratricopeptide (TPR) repeat protein
MTSRICYAVLALLSLFPVPAPGDSEALQRGVKALDRGDYASAIAAFDTVLKQDRTNAAAYFGRGRAYALKKNPDRALTDLSQAVSLDPGYTAAYFQRGLIYLAKRDADHALEDFGQVLRLDPGSATARVKRGQVYLLLRRDFKQAITEYTEALKLNVQERSAYFGRGMAYQSQKEYDRAIADLSQALALDPQDAFAYEIRARAYLGKKEYQKALSDLRRVVDLEPNDADSYNSLAWLLGTCPDPAIRDGKKAIALARKACELTEYKSASSLDTLAAAYAEDGQFTEAVRWQKQALVTAQSERSASQREQSLRRLRLYEQQRPYWEE